MGKLIVIEGVDASGKQTQTELLYKYISSVTDKVIKIEFPDYESPSSEVIKMYLNGAFGKDADAVNPYAASSFFAIDRFTSYKTKWEALYNDGYIIIADRYVTANMIYQASKFDNEEEKNCYLSWINDFEYEKLGLPRPDISLFLDVIPEISYKIIQTRNNKFTGEKELDIHEANKEYLVKTYNNAKYIAEKYSFTTIDCVRDNGLKSIEEIHDMIKMSIKELLYES